MKRVSFIILFIFFISQSLISWAQEPNVQVVDSLGNILYIINNGQVNEAATKKIILTIKANMIFSDTSDAMNNIELLVRSEDIFNKGIDHAYKADMHTVLFSISRGKFFLDDNNANNPTAIMAYYKVDNKGNLGLYTGQGNQLVAIINGNDVTTGELTAIFYAMMKKNNWDKTTWANIKSLAITPATTTDVSESSGTIRRVWNTGQDEFIWDGFSIKRKFNSMNDEEWTFDGKILRRSLSVGSVGTSIYTWDGKILKSKANPDIDQFEWDGKEIKRIFNTGQDEFSIEGNTVKRVWDATGNDEWETSGEVPVPVIAMVVFGLLSK